MSINMAKEKGTCDYCRDKETTRQIETDEEWFFICKYCYRAWKNGEWDWED